MKVSTKGRYGLRALIDIAIHSYGDHIPLNSIAERQEVSPSYLEQVFASLRKAGIVKSIKGAQGGYIIADSPSKITVGDILRVLEGDLSVARDEDTLSENTNINQIEKCIKENVWDKINNSINSIVNSITLQDLVNESKKLNNEGKDMYYI